MKQRKDLTNSAVSIDGQYIEDVIAGYSTLSAKGRESIAREFETYTVGTSSGETVKYSRYPARTITVEFLIKGSNSSELVSKMEHLSNILSSDESDFVFNDDCSNFFTGTAIMPSEVERGRDWISGEWQIYCAYPFKRSCEVLEVSPSVVNDTSAQFLIEYNGTYPARPVLSAEFAGALSGGDYSDDGDCGYVAFIDEEENIIQLGNPDAIDIDGASRADQLINRTFTTTSDFTLTGGHTFYNEEKSGSLSANQTITDTYFNSGKGQSLKYIKPAYGTGTGWHGPIIWKQVRPAGALNFKASIVHRMCINNVNQMGSFEFGLKNITSSGFKTVAAVLIIKDKSGTTGTVKYIAGGKVVKTASIDLSYYNSNFGYCKRTEVYKTQYYNSKKKKWQDSKIKKAKTRKVVAKYTYTGTNLNTSITKQGGTITFKVGGLAAYSYTDSDLENQIVHTVELHFGQYKTNAALHTNAVSSLVFTANPAGNFADIPNVFTSGDIVEADCNDASVYIMHSGTAEGGLSPQYGALGNDWEDFTLTKGTNIIDVVWSDWVNPAYKPVFKIAYNEVYI